MKFESHKLSKTLIFFIAFVLFFAFMVSRFSSSVKAQTPTNTLGGYAWSSNIGWVSFATSTYNPDGVSVDDSGNITGYAWSPNIGWIKFGGLSDFPLGSSTVSTDAVYSSSTGTIAGWARACAGTADGVCGTSDSRTDGWDGWISLSGTGYGVTSGTPASDNIPLSGFAWGSDVVGWLDFSNAFVPNVSVDGSCGSSQGGSFLSAPTENLCDSGTPSSVTDPSNGNHAYTWSCSDTNENNPVLCSANKICPSGQMISRIDSSCVPIACPCTSGYQCVNNSCLDTSTNCFQDGVVIPVGATSTFFSERISATCNSLPRGCEAGGILNGDTSFKYRKCVLPGYQEF